MALLSQTVRCLDRSGRPGSVSPRYSGRLKTACTRLKLQASIDIQDLRRSDPFDLEEAAGSALFLDPRSKTPEPDSHKLSASRSPSPAHARHSSFGGHGSTRGSSSTLGLFEPSAFAVSAPGQELANSSEEISPVAGAGRQSRTGSWSSTDNPRLVDAEGALLGSTSPRQRGLRQTPVRINLKESRSPED